MLHYTTPRIELLNTGTELLLGSTLNTHSAWLGRELQLLGLRLAHQTAIPDGDGSPITASIQASLARHTNVLIITGGLGPTSDDLTREATVKALGLELIEDELALRTIRRYFTQRGSTMAESNRCQAQAPVGADILPNKYGTAPGIYLPPRLGQGCAFFLLPGPPRELQPLYHKEVVPRLASLLDIENPPAHLELKFTGLGESTVQQTLGTALQQLTQEEDLEYGYCARIEEFDMRLMGSPRGIEKARKLLLTHFSDYYVNDNQQSLEQTVITLATEQQKTLALAESCTGGLISSRLTNVSGASAVITHGIVSYANQAKQDLLGVSPNTLATHGAVSKETALQMAEGALQRSGADLALAVTGIAGPQGGSPNKPVGTCFIALSEKQQPTQVFPIFYPSDRMSFKQAISQKALNILRMALLPT